MHATRLTRWRLLPLPMATLFSAALGATTLRSLCSCAQCIAAACSCPPPSHIKRIRPAGCSAFSNTRSTSTSGGGGGMLFYPTRVLRYRDIAKNTLAETPSGYVQDPRVGPGRMTSYERPHEQSRLTQQVLQAMAEEAELQERPELAYEGYTSLVIQACKASALLDSTARTDLLEEAAAALEGERERLKRLVGQAVPAPLTLSDVLSKVQQLCRSSKGTTATAGGWTTTGDPRAAKKEFDVMMNPDGSERMVLSTASPSAGMRREDDPEGIQRRLLAAVGSTTSPIARAAAYEAVLRTMVCASPRRTPSPSSSSSSTGRRSHPLREEAHPIQANPEEAPRMDDDPPVPMTVITPRDVQHVSYLLSLCCRRLGQCDRAEALCYEILSEDLRNVDAMESLLEMYCGSGREQRVRDLLEFLDTAHRDPAVQAAERAAVWEMEKTMAYALRKQDKEKDEKDEEGEEGELLGPVPDPLPPLQYCTPPATPSEMALGILADLLVESAASQCAEGGEGATARFFLHALGDLVKAVGGVPPDDPAAPPTTGKKQTSNEQHQENKPYVIQLMEATYRIVDDQCATAKAAAAAGSAYLAPDGSAEAADAVPRVSAGFALHQNHASSGRFGEEDIEQFLSRVQRSRMEASKRPPASLTTTRTTSTTSSKAESDEKEGSGGDGDAASDVVMETPESLAAHHVEQGERIAFTLVVAFMKLALQRRLFHLTSCPAHYEFLTLHRLYESLRHLQRHHESYGIFQQLERFYEREMKDKQGRLRGTRRPERSPAPEASQRQEQPSTLGAEKAKEAAGQLPTFVFPQSQHFEEFKDAYFTCMSDRVMDLTTNSSSSGGGARRHGNGVPLVLAAMERYPGSAAPWVLLALLLHQEGAVEDALLAAKKAVQLEPWHLNGVFTLANLYGATRGCQALSIRMMDRYRLLTLLMQQGATEEDVAGTLQELVEMSTTAPPSSKGGEQQKEGQGTSDSSAAAGEMEEDGDIRVDRALEAFYMRLQSSVAYSLPIDAAPREFATPPVLVPSTEQDITDERPALMKVPVKDTKNL
eukprot:gene9836-6909_t